MAALQMRIPSSDEELPGSDDDGVFGGSWYDSDSCASDASYVDDEACAVQREERFDWLARYWSVSDVSYNRRLVETADLEIPLAAGGPVPDSIAW